MKRLIEINKKLEKITNQKCFFNKFCKYQAIYDAINKQVIEMSNFVIEASIYCHYKLNTYLLQGKVDVLLQSSRFILDMFYELKQKSKAKYQLEPDYEFIRNDYNLNKYKVVCGNSMNFLATQYETILKNNIWMHAYSRIRKFFKNATKVDTHVYTPTVIYQTLDTLFNKKSQHSTNEYLIELLKNELQFDIGNFHDIEKYPLKYIPLFYNLQKYNELNNINPFKFI